LTDTTQIPPAPPAEAKKGIVSATANRLDRRTVNGFIVLLGVVGICYSLLFHSPPTEAKDFLLMLLGLLGGMAKDVIGYDFGSSAGSEKKDDAMIATAKKDDVKKDATP